MDIRKISIVGTGTLGFMYGQFLNSRLPEGSVRFVADESVIETYKNADITCNGEPCRFTFIPFGTVGPADLVIFAMRFCELDNVIRRIGSQIGKNTVILSFINGITSQDLLSRAFGNGRVLLCTVQGTDVSRSGSQIRYSNMGVMNIGTNDGLPSDFMRALTAFFDSMEFPYRCHPDMKKNLWERLVFNTGICQAVAVYETDFDGVKREGEPRQIMISAMKEAVQVGQAEGVPVDDQTITDWLTLINGLDGIGISSMRRDLRAGRPTEVELFSGTIRALGQKHGIPTPTNDFLYERIKEMELREGE